MKFRPLVASIGIAALLALAACGGGPGGNATAPERAPDQVSGNEQRPRPTASASQAPNEDQDTTRAQISTFALDVDTASYGYARRTLAGGPLARAAARSGRRSSSTPSGRTTPSRPDDGFTVHVDGARLPDERTVAASASACRPAPPPPRRGAPPTSPSWSTSPARWPSPAGSTWSRRPCTRCSTSSRPATRSPSWPSATGRGARPDDPARPPGTTCTRPSTGSPSRAAPTWRAACCRGYEHAAEGFRPAATNRVILLSDGLANQATPPGRPSSTGSRSTPASRSRC